VACEAAASASDLAPSAFELAMSAAPASANASLIAGTTVAVRMGGVTSAGSGASIVIG